MMTLNLIISNVKPKDTGFSSHNMQLNIARHKPAKTHKHLHGPHKMMTPKKCLFTFAFPMAWNKKWNYQSLTTLAVSVYSQGSRVKRSIIWTMHANEYSSFSIIPHKSVILVLEWFILIVFPLPLWLWCVDTALVRATGGMRMGRSNGIYSDFQGRYQVNPRMSSLSRALND